MQFNIISILKIFIMSAVFQFQFSYAGESIEADEAKIQYRVIPFENYMETAKYPPDLLVKFKLKCFQKYIKLIREDIQDPVTNEVTILIGAIVSEKSSQSCSSTSTRLELAGSTFSGRGYKVEPLL